jgi:hypothetical protein
VVGALNVSRRFSAIRVLTIAWISALALPTAASAGTLDVALMSQVEAIRDHLVERRYESVGVLAFRLQRGKSTPSFEGAMIVQSLADRLESGLIACLRPEHRLLVVHDASATAGRKLGAANYRTEEDRSRLFEVDYQQAWGNPPPAIKVDAFLVGKIILSEDLRNLKVLIEVFDRRDPGVVRDVVAFETDVDRHVLADVGQGFSLSANNPDSLLRAVTEDDVFDVIQKKKQTATPVVPAAATSDVPNPLKIDVYYDDELQPLTLDSELPGNANYVLPTPTEGRTLKIGVGNLTDQTLGLVVSVNGASTLYAQKGSPEALKKWVLEPKVEYLIKGIYQQDGQTYKAIQALSEQQSRDRFADLGGDESAGLIQIHIFRPVPPAQITSITTSPSIRLLSDSELADHKPGTLDELQSLIVPGKFNRGLFSWGDTRTEALEKGSLGPVQLSDTLIIRYYRKSERSR